MQFAPIALSPVSEISLLARATLEALRSEERQRLYEILRLEVLVPERGPVEARFGTSADIVGLNKRPTKTEGPRRSARMAGRAQRAYPSRICSASSAECSPCPAAKGTRL